MTQIRSETFHASHMAAAQAWPPCVPPLTSPGCLWGHSQGPLVRGTSCPCQHLYPADHERTSQGPWQKEVKSPPSCRGWCGTWRGCWAPSLWTRSGRRPHGVLPEKGCEPLMVRSPLATRQVQMSQASPRALPPGLGVRWPFMKQLSTQSWTVVWTSGRICASHTT